MSKVVDQRVVEMQFDNRHFEKNVATSMSTLDKLKQKLNIGDSAKSLETIDAAARKVNLNGLGSSIETVSAKFSALQIAGVTALANLTNSAVNAGKRIVEALTIAPIGDGFQEYEMTLNAVQTTMAATGKTADEVQEELKKLDEYADKTVYSTADMLNNLPKFTNAGVELEKATKAMIGIANATAVAGGDAGKASIAFYNLGQAIGTGYLTRMDYNSINNAGIATMEWKNQMVEAAIAQGTLTKVGEDAYKAGNKTLSLQQLFIDGLQEQWATTEVMMKVFGDYGDETTEIGKKAYSSAQDIKTFTQMMESLKATAGTGWKDTWQIVFGDLDEAKALWTGLSEVISGIIGKAADFRNTLLEGVLGSPFAALSDRLKSIFKAADSAADATKKVAEATKDYGDIVKRVIGGELGNGQERWDKLAQMGYDWAKVQNMVNEQLGNSKRYTEQAADAQEKLVQTQVKTVAQLVEMSDAQLKNLGFTEAEVEAFRELEEQSKKTGIPIEDLIKDIDQLSGRSLLINSFKNVAEELGKAFEAVKDAWQNIFPPKSIDERAAQLYDLIASVHKFTAEMNITDEQADKLRRTFEGLFAVIDIVATITGGAFRIAFELVKDILSYFNLDILDVTASVGDAIVKFRDFIDATMDFTGVIEKIAPHLKTAAEAVKEWIEGLKATDNIPKYIIEGLVQGLIKGASMVWDAMVELAKSAWEAFCNFFGINSPSTLMIAAGGFIIAGLAVGLKNGISEVVDVAGGIGQAIFDAISTGLNKLIEFLKDVDFGAVLAAGIGIGGLVIVGKFVKALESLISPIEGIGDMFEGLGDMFEGIGKNFKASAWEKRAKAFLNMALAVGVLAAAVAVLARLDSGSLWGAVGAVAALTALMAGLAFIVGKFGPKDTLNLIGFGTALLGLGTAILMISSAVKKLAELEGGDLTKALAAITALSALIVGLIAATKLFGNGAKIGSALTGMAIAMLLLVAVIKIVSGMNDDDLQKGLVVVTALSAIIAGLVAATNLFNGGKVGGTLLAMSTSMLLLVAIIKLIAGIEDADLERGLLVIIAFGGIITALMAATKLFNTGASNIGSTLLAMSTAILMMTAVVKLLAGMDEQEILKGVACITAFGLVMVALTAATKLAGGGNLAGVPTTLLAMSVAIGILAGIAALLGMIKLENLVKGVAAVGVLSAMMAMLVAATKNAQACKDELIILTVAIGVMAVALAGLSLIDPSKLAAASASLSAVTGTFALLVTATKFTKNTKQMRTSLLTMVGVVAALALVVAALAQVDSESAIPNTLALSILLTTLSASLAIMGATGRISTTVSKQIGPMLAVVTGLATILGVMSALDVEASIPTATAISILMTAMAGALAIMSLAGPHAKAGVGALALMGLVVAELALVLGAMDALDVEPSIETAASLSLLLVAMSGALVLLTAVGAAGPAAFIGIGALATLIAGIGGLIVAIGALVTEFPILEEFLNTGMPLIEKIGYAIGSFFGNIVGGFIGNLTSGLPDIATDLSNFMTNLKPFIDGAKGIDEGTVAGVKIIAETMLILSAASIMDTIAGWLNSGMSLSEFAAELIPFGEAMVEFSSVVSGNVDEGAITAVANAGKMMAEMASMLPNTGGVVGWFMGENDMEAFAAKLVPFGQAMVQFSSVVSGSVDEGAITAAANAGKIMTEMANTIPNTGGLVGWFVGENDMDMFGQKLVSFGRAIVSFSGIVAGNVSEDSIVASANAGKMMAEMADTIPNTGGVISWFAGDNDMATFGTQLVAFGKAMANFSKTVSGQIDAEAVTAATNAGRAVAELANTLPDSGGIGSWFKGDNTMDAFGKQLVKFGESIRKYSGEVSGINTSAMSGAAAQLKVIIDIAKGMEGIAFESLGKFGDNLNKIGKDGIEKFIKAFTDAEDRVVRTGKALVESLLNGVKSEANTVSKTFSDLASMAATSAKSGYQDFYNAGQNLAIGFASGISANSYRAASAASAMAASAIRAARIDLGIASPSKVFYKIGEFTGMGFVNALNDYTTKAYDAAQEVGLSARTGLGDTMSKIANVMNVDMDFQPTIRPVLDMSDVRAGVGSINSMFNNSPSVGVLANVGAISTQMSRNGQNGNNADVVSAINKLRGDLGNLGTTQYNINGITYDDGSNIADAVKTIARRVKIERRV